MISAPNELKEFNRVGVIHKEIWGKWIKITRSRCSELYPDELDFHETGIYFGKKGEETRHFTIWDAGDYYIISDDLIKISTANDEEITYQFWIDGRTLKFKDNKGCEFSYKKIGS